MTTKFSLKEAAVIADVPERTIHKWIENMTIQPERLIVGRRTRYRFDARDLVYLKSIRDGGTPCTDPGSGILLFLGC